MNAKKSAQTFATVGETLYGSRWRSELAAELDVNERTVRRWAAGEQPVPLTVWAELEAMCRSRAQALGTFAASIAVMRAAQELQPAR